MANEAEALTLMGIASEKLVRGENLMALQMYTTAVAIDFEDQRHARLGAAIAKSRSYMFKEATKDLEALLADKATTPEGTVFRADVLRHLCEVKVAMQQLQQISPLLKEAADIYKHQGVLAPLGEIIHLQGFVAGQNNKPDEAIKKFEWGVLYARINIPGIQPFSVGIEGRPAEAFAREALATTALVGSRN